MIAEPATERLADGTELRGTAWRVNDCWMLMLHEPGNGHDIDEVVPLVGAVARSGASVVAFDLPGHGFSDGDWNDDRSITAVVRSLLDWIDRRGPAKVGIVALGAACYPALDVAADRPIEALILISPPPNPDLQADPRTYRGDGAAKLFVMGGADAVSRTTAIELRQRSIGWAVSLSVGSTEQGAALIAGPHGPRVEEGIELFLREQWTMGRRRDVSVNEREREIAQ